MAATMKQGSGDQKFLRMCVGVRNNQLTQKEQRIFLPQALDVDSIFFQFFDFPLLKGDPASVLQKPNSIVLTASTAQKLFGQETPLENRLRIMEAIPSLYMVTGIMKDIPENSQLQMDAVISQARLQAQLDGQMGRQLAEYLFRAGPHTDIAALEKKFPAICADIWMKKVQKCTSCSPPI